MNPWLIYILTQGGITAVAAVGLGLHLRLVRFFDLGWALWAISAAFVGVYMAGWSSSPLLGIIAGSLTAAVLGVLEDGVVFRNLLTSFVPFEAVERFSFGGALAAYLAVASLIQVVGLRDQASIPATTGSWLGLSWVQVTVVISCWGLLGICALLRYSKWSLPLRALLEDSRACPAYGMRVRRLALVTGGLSGLLTGVAASSFGVLYFAHTSTGFSLMLLAVVPCVLIGPRRSSGVAAAAVISIGTIGIIRFYLGDNAAEFLVQVTLILLLICRPSGFVISNLREI